MSISARASAPLWKGVSDDASAAGGTVVARADREGSIRPDGSFHGRAQHQPTLGRGEIGACVRGAAIVPEQEVAEAPGVLVDEFAPLGMIEHRVKQRLTLL